MSLPKNFFEPLDPLDQSKEFGQLLTDVICHVSMTEEKDYFKYYIPDNAEDADHDTIMAWYDGAEMSWDNAPWDLLRKYPHIWVDSYRLQYLIFKAGEAE